MKADRASPLLIITAVVLLVLGLALGIGGIWLLTLGGSWYYVLAAAGLLLTGFLLLKRRAAVLVVYAVVVAGTLIWALWEAGLDWWPLAARGDVIFLLGLLLLTPWITRALDIGGKADEAGRKRTVSALRGAGLPLTASLVVALVVAVISWFNEPHRIEGVAPEAREARAAAPQQEAEGEWRAYGGGPFGQRYSPLSQITPENVADLEVAWTYNAGDFRGQPGDPVETTFEVTPLKIGDRLFLCTPHQSVVALDADSGEEIWR